jgi:hypothetical protein
MANDAPHAPPGWYPDPERAGAQRYWDGHAWADPPTEPLASLQPPVAPAQGPQREDQRPDALNRLARQFSVFWLAALSCALMIVGGLGTWATALAVISISGTRGDGWIAVAAAAASLCALWAWAMRPRAWLMIAAALFGAGSAVAVGIDLHKIAGIGSTSFFGKQVQLVHPAWGIYLAMGASVALAGFALATAGLGPPDDSGRPRDLNAGIALATIIVAIGAVVAVTHLGTPTERPDTSLASSAATETTSSEEPATTEEPTSATEATPPTTSSEPAPASGAGSEDTALEALDGYWSDIAFHQYAAAYSHLGAASAGLNESQFIAAEDKAQIGTVHFDGTPSSTSSSSATIRVVSLTTHDQEFGCRTWSGSYTMSKESGTWLIEKAALTPTPCSG